jgi:hypothetical protein
MIILTWILISYGLMNIMVYGSIFNKFRNSIHKWSESELPMNDVGKFISGILSCPLCFSTWGGFFLGFFVYSPSFTLFGVTPAVSWFFDGLLSAGSVWALNSVIEWFEENRPASHL